MTSRATGSRGRCRPRTRPDPCTARDCCRCSAIMTIPLHPLSQTLRGQGLGRSRATLRDGNHQWLKYPGRFAPTALADAFIGARNETKQGILKLARGMLIRDYKVGPPVVGGAPSWIDEPGAIRDPTATRPFTQRGRPALPHRSRGRPDGSAPVRRATDGLVYPARRGPAAGTLISPRTAIPAVQPSSPSGQTSFPRGFWPGGLFF